MTKASKNTMKILGVALLVTGIGLAYWGYQISGGLGSQLNQAITGSHTDKVMALYISGAACFFAGLFVFLKK